MEAINDAIDRIAKKINVNVKKKATIAGSLNELANALGADKATGGNIYEALRNVNDVYSGSSGSGEGGDELAGKSFVVLDEVNSSYTTIESNAFKGSLSIASVNFPDCTSIGENAFANCSSLTEANFPACTSIGRAAFATCSSLTEANFPVCTYIESFAFATCSSLTEANFPACTNIGIAAFNNCSSLTEANFPVCTNISGNAFQNCSSLTSVSFPVCTSIDSQAFYSCSSLTSVSFPVCTSIGSQAFQNCYKLLSLYLLGSSVCTLQDPTAFTSTPILDYTTSTNGVYGSIYVPASLYESYKTAANWSYYSSRFVSIA